LRDVATASLLYVVWQALYFIKIEVLEKGE
jgi:hypothetical protein